MSTKVSTDLIDLSSNTGGLVWAKGPTTDQPASATAGEMRVDTTTNTTLVYNGTQWKTLKETAFVAPPVPTHFLVVAGGGAGGRSDNNTGSGAGGAGGLRTSYGSTSGGNSSAESNIEISLNTPYNITVGNGGAGTTTATNGNQGTSSTFSTITSIGGGGGFIQRSGSASTVNGGSGGGGEGFTTSAGGSGNPGNGFGTGTADQGKDGGVGSTSASAYGGGGGGGAITVGGGGSSTSGGSGGTGLESSITGTATFFAGGGGGGSSTATGGTGGSGIGGNGGSSVTGSDAGDNGVLNTGSGGGGGGNMVGGAGGSGGSGVVILRYPTADLPYFTTTGTLNTPSATDTVADVAYPVTNLAYYKLDSNANDSGLGSGYIGQGGIFNGSSSFINTTYTIPAISTYSLSLWFKTSITGIRQYLFADFNSSANTSSPRLTLAIAANNNFQFYLGNGSSNWTDSSSASALSYLDGNWHNLVLVINGTSVKLYADGNTTPIADLTSTVSAGTAGTSPVSIGRIGDYPLLYFNGSIDQVRIFPTSLSSSNVSLLYAETSATSSTLNYPVTATALYELSGNANDTGNTYNGTATNVLYAYNGTATDVTYGNGRFNEAANFNGSTSVIDLPDPLNITTDFTLSGWVSAISGAAITYLYSSTDTNNDIIYFNFAVQPSQNRFFVVYDGVAYYTNLTYESGWHHYAITFNGTSLKVYRNGSLLATHSISTVASISGSKQTIGARVRQNYNDFGTGSIDQVRIFSSALAAGDVEDLYNEHFQTKFTDGSDTALKFTGGTGDITFADTAPVFTPGDNFNTVLYTGNNGTQSITGVGFQPDFTWIKVRDFTYNHRLFDSVRSLNGRLESNTTAAEVTNTTNDNFVSFDSNGFTLGATSSTNGSNDNNKSYVAWNWKAGGAARNNTDGSIASLVSANVDAGFSIVSQVASSGSWTVGHGLDVAPEIVFYKNLDLANAWGVWVTGFTDRDTLYLNAANAKTSVGSGTLYGSVPTSTTIGTSSWLANSGNSVISYCFHSVAGYSKIGSYTGTGASGNTIVTGFEPAFVMIKSTGVESWYMMDNKRLNGVYSDQLYANLSNAEGTGQHVDFTSNGFQLDTTDGGVNNGSASYIYMAFATNPT